MQYSKLLKIKNRIAIILLIFLILLCNSCTRNQNREEIPSGEKLTPPPQLLNLQSAFVRIAESVKPAVVNISATRIEKSQFTFKFRSPFGEDPFEEFFKYFFPPEMEERKFRSIGTGVIIDPRGYVLTNYHVVEGARNIQVALNDGKNRKTFSAQVVGRDAHTDLAVIKINGRPLQGFRFPVARLGDSDKIEVGEWAIAIGSPFGLEHTVTVGVISAKRQNVSVEGRNYEDLIQTDASINPGNSGGPLVNIYGEVIGINVAIFTPSGGFVGVGFAIPINRAKDILSDLIARGSVSRGWLGVRIQEITPELSKAFKLPEGEGVIISDVIPSSPAQEGGLRRGDVITRFNHQPVAKPEDLQKMVSKTKPGTNVAVEVIRENRKLQLYVKLGEMEEEEEKTDFSKDEGRKTKALGLTVQNHEEGVLVVNVEPSSLAQNAGILEGDIIQEIDRKPVKNISDFRRAIKEAGKSILFLIKRGDATVYIAVNME